MEAPSVVVINNDSRIVALLIQALTHDAYRVVGAVGDREGYTAIHTHHPQLVVLDTAPAGDWYILTLNWPDGSVQRAYPLEMPFNFDDLRAKVASVLRSFTEAPPLERSRGATDT